MLKFISTNRNLLILGALLTSLPVLLVLSQNQQIFHSQANVNDPAVTGITSFNSPGTSYPLGQPIVTTVALNSAAGHFDAYYIKSDTRPTIADVDRFVEIPELTGRPAGNYPWSVPAVPGHYWFAVNAHKIPAAAHGVDDWNPAASDIGCSWDSKIYEGPSPLRDTGQTCSNVGLKEFWVGPISGASPSPASSVTSPTVDTSRPPYPSPFIPAHLASACLTTDFGCLSKDPVALTGALYNIGLGLVGGVGILFMIIGAFMVLSSQGDPIKLSQGRSYIMYSIMGILLALFGYGFYQIITVDILHLPGFSR